MAAARTHARAQRPGAADATHAVAVAVLCVYQKKGHMHRTSKTDRAIRADASRTCQPVSSGGAHTGRGLAGLVEGCTDALLRRSVLPGPSTSTSLHMQPGVTAGVRSTKQTAIDAQAADGLKTARSPSALSSHRGHGETRYATACCGAIRRTRCRYNWARCSSLLRSSRCRRAARRGAASTSSCASSRRPVVRGALTLVACSAVFFCRV